MKWMEKLLNQDLKLSPLKNNAVYSILFILREETEAQRQDLMDNLQGPVKIKMQNPLFKSY